MKEDDFVNISLKLYHADLHYHMLLVIILSELRRSTPFTFLENTVEIRDIVKTTMITNLYNCHSTVCKQSGCMTKTDINDVFGNTLVGAKFEESTECRGCHRHETGKRLQPYLLTIVCVDIFFHFLHPATVGSHTYMGKGAR